MNGSICHSDQREESCLYAASKISPIVEMTNDCDSDQQKELGLAKNIIARQPSKNKQRAFILLPVIFTLTILAAVAYLLSREGAINAGNAKHEQQQDAALYVAQAGYNQAIWYLNQQNCKGYADIPSKNFGSHNYSAFFTDSTGASLTAGSPGNIKITGTLLNGASYTIKRKQVKIYQSSFQEVMLRPDAAKGVDTWVTSGQPTNNYGTTNEMVISGGVSPKHFLSKFDISSLPKESKIISAKLEMNLNYMTSEDLEGRFNLYKMSQNWAEGSGDWWDPGDGANWNTSDGSHSWSWDSNHNSANVVASTLVNPSFSGWHKWEIGSLVQLWISGLSSNFGLLIKGNENVMGAGFYSSDKLNASDRPKLTIVYTCECGKTCGSAASAVKKIYWTDDVAEIIQRSDEDGSNVETVISNQFKVRGLDIDTVNGKIYWTSDDNIKRADLDGSNIETVFTTSTGLNFDVKIDIAGSKMYWTYDNNQNDVMRANLDGSQVEKINSSTDDPMYFSLDVAAGFIYLTNHGDGDVSRINLDGSGTTKLVTGSNTAMGNAIDTVNGKIYWTGGLANDWIKRADFDGNNIEEIVSGLNAPQDIVYDADNDRIYWTDGNNSVIQRANADGSSVETIVSGLDRPRGIVIADANKVPPTAAFVCNGFYGDEFNTVSFNNNNNSSVSFVWASKWIEINESDGPNRGDERIVDDNGHSSLRLRDNDGGGEGVEREADLSGATSATLSLLYRREALDNNDDRVTLFISANGSSGPWSELVFFAGGGSDSDYVAFSIDISSFISVNTRIRLVTSSAMGKNDAVYFDDIQIQCSP